MAQSFTIDPTLTQARTGTFYEDGLGAPSVAVAQDKDQLVMFFETQTGPADASCPDGYWSIGYGWSADGVNWRISPQPVLEPAPGSYTGCGMRHPSTLRANGTHIVTFSSLQEADTCVNGTVPSWGCTRDSGIGYAMFTESWSQRRLTLNSLVTTMSPMVGGAGYAEPTVLRVGNKLHLYVEWLGEVQHATSTDLVNWTFDQAPVLSPGLDTWSDDQLYSPSVSCMSVNPPGAVAMNATNAVANLFYGGRAWDGGTMTSGWSNAETANGTNFMPNPAGAAFTYGTLDEFVSIEGVMAGSTSLVWFEEIDSNGKPAIGFASDGPWTIDDVQNRTCR